VTPRVHFDFDDLFHADEYLYFMEQTLREEDTRAQCDFVANVLALGRSARVVDFGCGHGRHANELARRGHRVVGVDRVPGFVELARAEAERESLDAEFVEADLRALRLPSEFDAAICLFDAFGYFADEEQALILDNFYAALRPGGRLLLDVRTREWMVRVPAVSVLDKGNGDMMIDRHHFDIESGRFVDHRTYVRGGSQRDVRFSVRLYAYTELCAFLRARGFEILGGLGGYDGAPLSLTRPRTLVVAQRPLESTLAEPPLAAGPPSSGEASSESLG
jgi:SAM-dependent methyltransferase